MASNDMTGGPRTSGPRHILRIVPLLAILMASGCGGCFIKPTPIEIKDLEALHWSVQQLADSITIENKDCTDPDLATLAKYAEKLNEKGLEMTVVISGSQVTDAGLANIKSLVNVSKLDVSQTSVTGAGLGALGGWTHLKSLDLSETKVDDNGLAHLSKLSQLNSLTLDGCPVTGAGLGNLKNLAELQSLRLDKTQVDDAGLATLPPLPGLKNLRLNETRITDLSIAHLKQFTALEQVWVKGVTGLTDEAVQAWQAANEELVIER